MQQTDERAFEALGLRHDKTKTVTGRIGFLEHDPIFEHEEPYAFRYEADVPMPLTNMKTTFQAIEICDFRGQECHATLNTCGFSVHKLRSEMQYDQFARQDCVEDIYVRDLKKQLVEDFGATEVDIARVRVRRRHPAFPKSTGFSFEHHQPSTAAHIDASANSAKDRIACFHGEDALTSLGRRFLIINIWKPLRGPLEDWPLAVCDARTVNASTGMTEATILHKDYVNHNCQVHFDQGQQWYYLRHQLADELIIFRQYDSRLQGNNGVPHSSFRDPTTPVTAPPRESVEVMAILYFG